MRHPAKRSLKSGVSLQIFEIDAGLLLVVLLHQLQLRDVVLQVLDLDRGLKLAVGLVITALEVLGLIW